MVSLRLPLAYKFRSSTHPLHSFCAQFSSRFVWGKRPHSNYLICYLSFKVYCHGSVRLFLCFVFSILKFITAYLYYFRCWIFHENYILISRDSFVNMRVCKYILYLNLNIILYLNVRFNIWARFLALTRRIKNH